MTLFSVLGDSISTFEGCNPAGFNVFYEGERRAATGVELPGDTWWSQVIAQRGGRLLANSSFSGSMVEGVGFPAANSPERIAALGHEGIAPQVVLVFMGTNDYGWGGAANQAAGRANALPVDLDVADIPPRTAGLASADAPERFGGAYEAMLARIRHAYPQAQVWCATLCPGRIAGSPRSTFAYRLRGVHLDQYNDAIRAAARVQGCRVADIRALGCDYEALEGTHPTKRGMRQLAQMVLRAMERAEGADADVRGADALRGDARDDAGVRDADALRDAGVLRGDVTPWGASEGLAEAPRSLETCDKPSCIGCADAAATGNTWLCVCRR